MLKTLAAVKGAHMKTGGHFFDASTMRFFSSRVIPRVLPVDDGAYFVTSERYDSAPRLYTLRRAYDDGRIETVGEFQQYTNSAAAFKAAQAEIQSRVG